MPVDNSLQSITRTQSVRLKKGLTGNNLIVRTGLKSTTTLNIKVGVAREK